MGEQVSDIEIESYLTAAAAASIAPASWYRCSQLFLLTLAWAGADPPSERAEDIRQGFSIHFDSFNSIGWVA